MRKIQQFMKNRCGIDELNILLLFLSLFCYFLFLFLPMDAKLFSCIACLIFLTVCICRMFSQNLKWRKKENAVLLKVCAVFIEEGREEKNSKTKKRISSSKKGKEEKKEESKEDIAQKQQESQSDGEEEKTKERKKRGQEEKNQEKEKVNYDSDYVYFNCPYCNQAIRIPKKQGRVKITCPTCKNKFIKVT